MLSFLAELIGTFIFLSVIIITGNPIAIGATLTCVIWLASNTSGGHFNPAVNLLMFFNNKMSLIELINETIAQVLGAIAAFIFYKNLKKKK